MFAVGIAHLLSWAPTQLALGLIRTLNYGVSETSAATATQQMAISAAHNAFSEDGSLKDSKQHEAIAEIAVRLAVVLKKLNS